jgi:hypothetical protein
MHKDGGVRLFDNDFFIAFGMRNFVTDEYKDDADYVQWQVSVLSGDGSTTKLEHTILTHICNEKDWTKF